MVVVGEMRHCSDWRQYKLAFPLPCLFAYLKFPTVSPMMGGKIEEKEERIEMEMVSDIRI
jgi:hypothetical protein